MFDIFYFNFYTIGALIPALFTAAASYMFLTVKKKSMATRTFLHFMIGLFLFNSAYFITAVTYHPVGAYHRWFTVAFILPVEALIARFYFVFPEPRNMKFSNILFRSQLGFGFIVTAIFIYLSIQADIIYHFDGHYWDFDIDEASKFVGIIIQIYVFILVAAGIWRTWVTKDKHMRIVMIMINISIIIVTIIPSIFNTLSREGVLSRTTYQTAWDLLVIIGLFGLLVVYINNTKDRTTFIAKLIGITMVIFLLMLQAINYITITDKDESYDELKKNQLARIVNQKVRPDDLLYLVKIHKDTETEKNIFSTVYQAESFSSVSKKKIHDQLTMSNLLNSLEKIDPENYEQQAQSILDSVHGFSAGYKNLLRENLTDSTDYESFMTTLSSVNETVAYHRKKIKKISTDNFKEKVSEYFENNPEIKAFKEPIHGFFNETGASGRTLKNETLNFFSAAHSIETRYYQKFSDNIHAVAYLFLDSLTNELYEVGFEYRSYREYIHPLAMQLTIILMVIVLVVLFGFRYFFFGVLIKPLESLLSGVTKVKRGHLDVKIPVIVEDELGFISRSFNFMVESIKTAKEKLQDYADNLEDKVQERTAELQETLEEVNKLKEQQDGDYFLTSLLVNPLTSNFVRSDTVEVQFDLKQKKQFTFRKWAKELGGDLCTAHTIYLHDKPFTVFLNADAMGKSLQGAGGILVLGSVFQSMIERTHIVPSEKNLFPEKWLKNNFVELHKVFESFDGSMLISLVLGLIDDETGVMYYINAEHPFSILYRDNKAVFIEEELKFRKLGTTGVDGAISIETIQLQPGDVLFVGSDGKDDIVIKETDGEPYVNEDETRILHHIEKAKGDLESIFRSITSEGELKDDYSLIRVSYKAKGDEHLKYESSKEVMELVYSARKLFKEHDYDHAIDYLKKALSLETSEPEIYKALAKAYLRKKKYKIAAEYAEDYLTFRPASSNMLYLASFCQKMSKNFSKAASLGERLRLRDTDNINNLINLADIYQSMKNYDRGLEMIKHAMQLEPDNQKAIILETKIKKYME